MKGYLYIHCINNNHTGVSESTFACVQGQVKASKHEMIKEASSQNSQFSLSWLLRCKTIFQETLEDIDKNEDGFVDQDEYIGKCWGLFLI